MISSKKIKLLWGWVLILSMGMAGCGGGSGGGGNPSGSILNGVAALGTPIVNGNINVICAAGSPLSTTTSNTGTGGAWQVTLSGQNLPCAVEVSNGTINGVTNTIPYHSIAITQGTVNVTPLTDLMVANIVGMANPSTWFAGLKTTPAALTAITQTQVNTALADLSAALSGLTPLSANNPITTTFTPTSGNVSDDMLTALELVITNNASSVTYTSLLSEVSTTTVATTTVPAGFGTDLAAAYAGTASGGGSSTSNFSISGAVSGLTGSVVLQDNGSDNLTVSTNGSFTFLTDITNGGAYHATVLTQPYGQPCTVSNGAGLVSWGNVTNVSVVCATNTYSLGGTVSGLAGSMVLQNNNGNNLTVSANGVFTFPGNVANGSLYSVTVFTHPAGQSCSVANGTGTIALANVTNVTITCATNTYTIGGAVTGLSGSMVLQDNGGDNLTVSTNGIFNFPTTIAYGNTFNASVLTQPSGQTCTVTGGSGTVTTNVSSVVVACTAMTSASTNVLPIIVDAGPLPSTSPTINVPYVSVTICTPGSSTNCQTIDHIIVDTGSSGLRIMYSVLSPSLALTQQMVNNTETLDECLQFVDGYTWGSVKLADVKLGGEPVISSLAIQVIGDPNVPATPRSCRTGISENTVQSFGGNGILGVSVFQQDCGSACTTRATSGTYYACSGTGCQSVAIGLANQIQNPVGLLASDNNGVVIDLPSVSATGTTTASGSLILGIGTQSNNGLGNATVYSLDPTQGTFTTVFNSKSYTGSFIDSGSNALFFADSAIMACSSSFYCPASTLQLTATNQGTNGSSGTINFSVANADSLFGNTSYAAFNNLAGTAITGSGFDWGLPFFFGRTVFAAIEGTNSGGVSGPFVAY